MNALFEKLQKNAARSIKRKGGWVSLIFHDINDTESPLTEGLNVTHGRKDFELFLYELSKNYNFIGLDDLFAVNRKDHKKPDILLTFDDAYKSVATTAAPICKELKIPFVFFVNANFMDNQTLSLDNLVAYVVNEKGLEPINYITRRKFKSAHDVISNYISALNPEGRRSFSHSLLALTGIDTKKVLSHFKPYITSEDLKELSKNGVEIGNHTYTHAHLRSLKKHEIELEINKNKKTLEAVTGRAVRAFAFPYGNKKDATSAALKVIDEAGYHISFLVHNRHNSIPITKRPHMRISLPKTFSPSTLLLQLNFLPQVRSLRDRLRVSR